MSETRLKYIEQGHQYMSEVTLNHMDRARQLQDRNDIS